MVNDGVCKNSQDKGDGSHTCSPTARVRNAAFLNHAQCYPREGPVQLSSLATLARGSLTPSIYMVQVTMGMEYYAAQSANKRVYGDGLSSPLLLDTRFSAFSIMLNPGVIYVETEDEVMLKTATDFHPDYRYLLLEKLDRCSALRINDLRFGNARLRFSRFGSWVRITKGHYSGDLGRIVEFGVSSSHPADRPVWILVPARMRFHCASNSKCMTMLAPDGLPFAPKAYTYQEVAKIVGESKVFFHGENTFEVFHHIFVNGLYALPAKSSEFRAISFADPAEAFIFAQSNVPVHDITNRAYLRVGDSVVIHDNCSVPKLRGHSGKVIVRAIDHLSVQLHHPTLEGESRVFGLAYGDVHIQLTPGTWVSIEAGEHAGRTGAIVLVCQGRACLLSPNVDTGSFVELEDISGNFLRTLPPNLDVLRRGFFGCGQYPCCLERLIGHPVAIVGELYRGIGVLEYVWSSRATVRLRKGVYVALQLTDVISMDNWKTLMNAFSLRDGLQDHFLGSLTSESPVVWVFGGDHTGMGELVGFTDGVVLVWFPEKPNPRFQTVKADDVFSFATSRTLSNVEMNKSLRDQAFLKFSNYMGAIVPSTSHQYSLSVPGRPLSIYPEGVQNVPLETDM